MKPLTHFSGTDAMVTKGFPPHGHRSLWSDPRPHSCHSTWGYSCGSHPGRQGQ